MGSRTLDITLHSGSNLSKGKLLFAQMSVSAAVSIHDSGIKIPKQLEYRATPPDDAYPNWNFPMKFTLDEAALQAGRLSLNFSLTGRRPGRAGEAVGGVTVPVKVLLGSLQAAAAAADAMHFFTYPVWKAGGTPKGQLTFSCKFSKATAAAAAFAPPRGVNWAGPAQARSSKIGGVKPVLGGVKPVFGSAKVLGPARAALF